MRLQQMPPVRLGIVCGMLALSMTLLAGQQGALSRSATGSSPLPPGHWVATWGTAMHTGKLLQGTNFTCRFIARATIPGAYVRLHFANTFGPAPVTFGAVTVGLRQDGATLVPGSNRPITFGGQSGVTLAPGAVVASDSVALAVAAQADLAVSVFVTGPEPGVTLHAMALTTSACTVYNGVGGDHTRDVGGAAFTQPRTDTLWLTGIDVAGTPATGAVVALGDSLTDGYRAALDAHDDWVDDLARRLSTHGVVNAGVGGNTLTDPCCLPTALQRLDRDVFSVAGIHYLIVYEGSNDIVRGAPASTVEFAMQQIILRAHTLGIKVIGATLTPRNVPPRDPREHARQQVNAWMLTGHAFDSVADFNAAVRNPTAPNALAPKFDSGDHGHPNPAGYAAMARTIDVALIEGRSTATTSVGANAVSALAPDAALPMDTWKW